MVLFDLPFAGRRLRGEWAHPMGVAGEPYAYRWMLDLWLASVRVHHWIASDDARAPHDHSWWFWTFIVRGTYIDHVPTADGSEWGRETCERLVAGDVRYRPVTHRHWVEIEPGASCWSVLLTGGHQRMAGFWPSPGRRIRANKWFFSHGHHRRDGGSPARTRKIREGRSASVGRR